MNTTDRLRMKMNMASISEKMIAVNVIVFIAFFLIRAIGFLFNWNADSLLTWFVFSQNPADLLFKPWSIITYAFFHDGIWHLFFNMLVLYFSGRLFLTYFSPKRFLNYYFLGVIFGALFYMLSYNLFPVFQNMASSFLLGASAGVTAILIGIASYIPNMSVRLMLIGNVKLWWIAVFFVVMDIVMIPTGNAGGHIAHLGGAFLGFIYSRQLTKGNDIGQGFESIIDWFASLFKPKEKKARMKTVYRSGKQTTQKSTKSTATRSRAKMNKTEKQQKIDEILDKISKSGYDSLNKSEKDFLFQAGKED